MSASGNTDSEPEVYEVGECSQDLTSSPLVCCGEQNRTLAPVNSIILLRLTFIFVLTKNTSSRRKSFDPGTARTLG